MKINIRYLLNSAALKLYENKNMNIEQLKSTTLIYSYDCNFGYRVSSAYLFGSYVQPDSIFGFDEI